MPKPQKIRETSNPLGRKINQVMEEKQMAGDYAALAKIFEVQTPSTYDWVTHGRLGKDRYQRLLGAYKSSYENDPFLRVGTIYQSSYLTTSTPYLFK